MIAGLSDAQEILSKTTFRRAANALKIYSSFRYAQLTRSATIAGLPISLSIEPTTSCNLRCPECPSGLRSFTRPTGMLQSNFFQRVMDELHPTLSYLTLYFQGEPYLNPQFLQLVRYAADKGIYTATSTNGHFLKDEIARETIESGLDRLIISIDGTTQETYESYRIGGSLEKVLDGTANVVKWKKQLRAKKPQIIFQFLVVKPNEHQIGEVQRLATKLGVDRVWLKTAQIYDFENGSPLIPEQSKYSRYHRKSDGTYEINNALENHCWKMWHSAVITWDGKVVPCCFDKDASHVMGDLTKETFSQIWFGTRYKEFRNQLMMSRKDIDICRNCTEGTKVWA